MAKIYTMDISLVRDGDEETLSPLRRAKAESFIYERDRRLSLASSLLIERGLAEYGVREKDVEYAYGRYGKPYFRDYPSIHFNISHSVSMALAAFSSHEVGCDIERIMPYDEEVAGMCFTEREREKILSSPHKSLSYTMLWCIKESFLKALGVGLERAIEDVSVERKGEKVDLKQNIDRRKWKITTYVRDNYCIAICEEDDNDE